MRKKPQLLNTAWKARPNIELGSICGVVAINPTVPIMDAMAAEASMFATSGAIHSRRSIATWDLDRPVMLSIAVITMAHTHLKIVGGRTANNKKETRVTIVL